ncbi:MAG: type II toxin-antitoxin system HicB family antitoxin [Verrucomicrobiales bacterium]
MTHAPHASDGARMQIPVRQAAVVGDKRILDKSSVLLQVATMHYPVILERVPDEEEMPGHYYAHIPSLGLTTHGSGMEGALEAARDLATLWNEEKRAHGEPVPAVSEAILATVEVA